MLKQSHSTRQKCAQVYSKWFENKILCNEWNREIFDQPDNLKKTWELNAICIVYDNQGPNGKTNELFKDQEAIQSNAQI